MHADFEGEVGFRVSQRLDNFSGLVEFAWSNQSMIKSGLFGLILMFSGQLALSGEPLISMEKSNAEAATQFTLTVTITDIRSAAGTVIAALHRRAKGFPSNKDAIIATEKQKATAGQIELKFQNIPAGEYAIALHHDENDDGKMNYNFLGIPKEGFGFSGNKPVAFGPPSFDNAKIDVVSDKQFSVKMKYF